MSLSGLRSSLLLLCVSILFPSIHAQQATPPPTSAVDETRLTTLHGTVHPLALPKYDQGPVADDFPLGRLLLMLARPASREQSLQQFLQDAHQPGSAAYHQWLTPEQFGARFGATDQDTKLVSTWLQSHGLQVARVTKSKSILEFSATAGQIRQALHTEIHQYSRNGTTFYANASEISLPQAVAARIQGFAPLNNFPLDSYLKRVGSGAIDRVTHRVSPQFTIAENNAPFYAFAPEDFATQYDVAPVYAAGIDGAGQTIGIIGTNNLNLALVDAYRKLFNLPADHTQIVIDGQDPGDGFTVIDSPLIISIVQDSPYPQVEIAGAIAPGATVNFYIASGYGQNQLALAALRAIEDNQASVLSFGYSECEQMLGQAGNRLWDNLWQQAAAQGQTVLVSSGDGGPSACNLEEISSNGSIQDLGSPNVNGFASTPWNVSVGSTDFYYSDYASGAPSAASFWNSTNNSSNGSLKTPLPEQPSDSYLGLNAASNETTTDPSFFFGASGGGASNCSQLTVPASGAFATCIAGYPKPSWQNAPGVPSDQARDLPDVSLFAGGSNLSAVPICAQPGDCAPVPSGDPQVSLIGGSAVSSSSMAGVMALINQKYGRQGQANFTLYALARQFPAVFHDITLGTNDVYCQQNTSPDCNTAVPNNPFEESYGMYAAGTGYDLASGLGSIDVNQLLSNWNKIAYVSTSTTLQASPASFVHGSAVAVDVAVMPTSGSAIPTGNVVLTTDPGTTIPQNTPLALANGAASASLTNLPGGSYALTAEYGGDGTFAPSTSSPVALTVTPESSTTALTYGYPGSAIASIALPQGEVAYSASIHFMATPSGLATKATGLATGTVTFTDGATTATVPVDSNGIATWTPLTFALGAHSISAAYSGDASYQASTSAPLAVTVVKGTPEFFLEPNAVDSCIGSSSIPTGPVCTYQAGVGTTVSVYLGGFATGGSTSLLVQQPLISSTPPTGTVTVNLGAYSQTQTLGSYLPLFTFSSIPAGTYALSATYSGDTNWNAATYTSPDQITFVAPSAPPIATTTTLTLTPSSANSSGIVTFNVTVQFASNPNGPMFGSISLYGNGALFGSTGWSWNSNNSQVVTGSATIPASQLPSGALQVVAGYSGDQETLPSFSSPVLLTVTVTDFSLGMVGKNLSLPSGQSLEVPIALGAPLSASVPVTLTCATSSPSIACAIDPSSPTVVGNTTATLTVNAFTSVNAAQAAKHNAPKGTPSRLKEGLALALLLFVVLPGRKRASRLFVLLLLCAGLSGNVGCGGSAPVQKTGLIVTPAPAGSYTVTVSGVSAGITHNATLSIQVK